MELLLKLKAKSGEADSSSGNQAQNLGRQDESNSPHLAAIFTSTSQIRISSQSRFGIKERRKSNTPNSLKSRSFSQGFFNSSSKSRASEPQSNRPSSAQPESNAKTRIDNSAQLQSNTQTRIDGDERHEASERQPRELSSAVQECPIVQTLGETAELASSFCPLHAGRDALNIPNSVDVAAIGSMRPFSGAGCGRSQSNRTCAGQPLADRMRPAVWDDFVGQPQARDVLKELSQSGFVPSLILWGPPGAMPPSTFPKKFGPPRKCVLNLIGRCVPSPLVTLSRPPYTR